MVDGWAKRLGPIVLRPWRTLGVVFLLAVIGGSLWIPARLWWAEAHYRAAVLAFQERRFNQARQELDYFLGVHPNHYDGRFLLAQTARRAGFFDEADVHLAICEFLGGPGADVGLERALVQVQQGDLSWEGPLLERAAGPKAEFIYEALAKGYGKNYLLGKMKKCLDDWLQLQPGNSEALLQHGWVAERDANHTGALEDYGRILAIDPDHEEARMRRGQVLLLMKQPAEALKDLEWLHQRKPADQRIALGLAQCWLKLGRTGEAENLLDHLVARHADDAGILLERGRLALELGQTAAAEAWLRQALALSPRDHQVNYSLSLCLKKLGRDAEWRQIRATLKEIETDLARMAELTERLQKKPNAPELRCEIGRIFLRSGQAQEGLLWLESALRANPNFGPAHEALAAYYDRHQQGSLAARHRRLAGQAQNKKIGP